MTIRTMVFSLITLLFAGFWGLVWWELSPYPRGQGVLQESPDGRYEAVLLPIERVELTDAIQHVLPPRQRELRVQREIRIELIEGVYGSSGSRSLNTIHLPGSRCPQQPLNKKEIFRWKPDSSSCTLILRGTNLVLSVPDSDN